MYTRDRKTILWLIWFTLGLLLKWVYGTRNTEHSSACGAEIDRFFLK
jgi:hypothetical protein